MIQINFISITLGNLVRLIQKKKNILEYLKIMVYKLIDTLSTPNIIKEIINNNQKDYVIKKLNKKLNSGDTCSTEANLDSFKFKWLEKIRTQEPLEGD